MTISDPPSQFPPRADLKVAVLTNPGSLRNRRNIGEVRELLALFPHAMQREAQSPEQVAAAIDEFATAGIELLVLNTGDGGIGMVLAELLERRPFESPPLLSLIRGGNTNMDAGDVGQPESQLMALHKVLQWSLSGRRPALVRQRPVLKVQIGKDDGPDYGMFFGAGAIIKGIEYCHEAVHSKGFVDSLGPGLCTARVLLAMARGDPSFVAPVPMDLRPQPALDDGFETPEGDEEMLVVAVSTLEKLFMGLKPWWNSDHDGGALHLSTVHFLAQHKARTLPPLLWGRRGRYATPECGYRSGMIERLELLMDGPITLDGKIHHASREQGPVIISNGGSASFLVV